MKKLNFRLGFLTSIFGVLLLLSSFARSYADTEVQVFSWAQIDNYNQQVIKGTIDLQSNKMLVGSFFMGEGFLLTPKATYFWKLEPVGPYTGMKIIGNVPTNTRKNAWTKESLIAQLTGAPGLLSILSYPGYQVLVNNVPVTVDAQVNTTSQPALISYTITDPTKKLSPIVLSGRDQSYNANTNPFTSVIYVLNK